MVYAPKLRHADKEHAPPPIGKGFFSWMKPVATVSETEMVERMGMDATVFLRFTRMCRNMFLVMSILGCAVMIPINISHSNKTDDSSQSWLNLMTPLNVFGQPLWALVVCAWLFDIIIIIFLYYNYRKIAQLRRMYFASAEYQQSLYGRTLMITDIPERLRTNEGIARVIDEVNSIHAVPNAAIGRNVKELPGLIKQHDQAVKSLESVLAKYLKDPNNLPARPLCKPVSGDKTYARGQKIDAIEYYAVRIRSLENRIKEVRRTIDKKNPMSYGFASYDSIAAAHTIAYHARGKHPQRTTIKLATRPKEIIWENMTLSKASRARRVFVNNLWVILLTFIWVAPNAMIAIFLSNLSNLSQVWPAFKTNFDGHPKVWAAVQAIFAPALLSLVYVLLPIIFRRLSTRAGDQTRTSRERHVTHKLYAFFVFNNLIVFSFFGAIWAIVAGTIKIAQQNNTNFLTSLKEEDPAKVLTTALCTVSTFWLTWMLQRSLGSAIDLIQLINLFWIWFAKKFLSPTPRQLIVWTAPPPFDYASYYNYFLFYATVALCFATLQPIILPITALFFTLDSSLKKYLLMYVYITKHESGGQFWIIVFNRLIFAGLLANCLVALVIWSNGTTTMEYLMCPLLVIMLGFKFYCKRTFDDKIHYYATGKKGDVEQVAVAQKQVRRERMGVRFGHPVLSKPLITPMVRPEAQPILEKIYSGRLKDDEDDFEQVFASRDLANPSQGIGLQDMSKQNQGKSEQTHQPFEVVQEGDLDFNNFKDRPEFGYDHGAGSLYRSDTPADSMFTSRRESDGSSESSSRQHSPSRGFGHPPGASAGYYNTNSQPYASQPTDARDYASRGPGYAATDFPPAATTYDYTAGQDYHAGQDYRPPTGYSSASTYVNSNYQGGQGYSPHPTNNNPNSNYFSQNNNGYRPPTAQSSMGPPPPQPYAPRAASPMTRGRQMAPAPFIRTGSSNQMDGGRLYAMPSNSDSEAGLLLDQRRQQSMSRDRGRDGSADARAGRPMWPN
jgi:hypothetical protein